MMARKSGKPVNAPIADPHYTSVDSTPVRFSATVEYWRAPGLIVLFLFASYAQLWALDNIAVL